MKDLIAMLAAQPFLKGMSREHLELLAADSLAAEFHAGERILHEDAPANRFYLILEGRVDIESPPGGMPALPPCPWAGGFRRKM